MPQRELKAQKGVHPRVLVMGFLNQKRLWVSASCLLRSSVALTFFPCCNFSSAAFVLELLDEEATICCLLNFPVVLNWHLDLGNGVFATWFGF